MKKNELEDMIQEKSHDILTPGFTAEMTPEEADELGAFEETALSEEDARESASDMEVEDGQ